MNNEIDEEQLQVMHKILNKEVIAKEENNRLYNVKVAAFSFLRKVDDYISLPYEIILDQFAGSSNLAVAALNMSRNAIVIEGVENI